MIYETGSATFASDEDTKAIVFSGAYTMTPSVIITAGPAASSNLNVYVSNLSKLGCTLNLSDSHGSSTSITVNYKILRK